MDCRMVLERLVLNIFSIPILSFLLYLYQEIIFLMNIFVFWNGKDCEGFDGDDEYVF